LALLEGKVQATGIIETETVQAITAWPSHKTDAGLPGPKFALMMERWTLARESIYARTASSVVIGYAVRWLETEGLLPAQGSGPKPQASFDIP